MKDKVLIKVGESLAKRLENCPKSRIILTEINSHCLSWKHYLISKSENYIVLDPKDYPQYFI